MIDIAPQHLETIKTILHRHLLDREVCFRLPRGSRVVI